MVYLKKGDNNNALQYLTKALTISERNLGANHPNTATSYFNIGIAYYQTRKYQEALGCFEKALTRFVDIFGANHKNTLEVRKWLNATKVAIDKKTSFWQWLLGK